MIEVENLVKRYGGHLAVDHLSFTVEKGCVCGFLGPNGAGKSTTMNMMTGYLAPTEGEVRVDGHSVTQDPAGAKACIGYLRNQVALLKPKIIVCLGRIAAMKLIKEDFKITREHGQWIEKAGVWMMAMYHPSALLRDPRKRPESFEDLKSLQAKIREVCVCTY